MRPASGRDAQAPSHRAGEATVAGHVGWLGSTVGASRRGQPSGPAAGASRRGVEPSMRAAVYDTSGPTRGVLRLEDVPTPDPGPGQVRVRIEVAGVNPTDIIARRRGAQAGSTPQIPGQDGAGIIDDVGSGVRADRIG